MHAAINVYHPYSTILLGVIYGKLTFLVDQCTSRSLDGMKPGSGRHVCLFGRALP